MKESEPSKKSHFMKSISFSVVALLTVGCQSTASRFTSSSRWVSSEGSSIVSLAPSTQTWPNIPSQDGTKSDIPASSSMTTSELDQLENIRLVFLQQDNFGDSVCAFNNGTPLGTGMHHSAIVANKITYTTPQLYLYDIQYPYTQFPSQPSVSIAYTAGHRDGYQVLLDAYSAAGYEYGELGWIAFSDAEYPFGFAVTHHAYTVDAQPGRPDWTEVFSPLIAKMSTPVGDFDLSDTPLIFTDVWRFDLDGDGVDEELVRASNMITIPETDQILKPASDNTGAYNIMILFSKTMETTVVCDEKIFIQKLREDSDFFHVYEEEIASTPRKTTKGVYQSDHNGNLITCPHYIWGEGIEYVLPIPIVCDADNDGKPELIVVKHSYRYWTVSVYKAGLENGLLLCENPIDP